MSRFGAITKHMIKSITGFEVERIGGSSFLLVDQRQREEAWCSYTAQLRSLIEENQIDLVLDVGANEGQFVQKIRPFYSGMVISFEPVTAVFKRLEIAASRDSAWNVRNCALGERDGSAVIHLSEYSEFSSLLQTNAYCQKRFGTECAGRRTETIEIRRGDTLIQEIIDDISIRRIFLKMDTQGYDLQVFEGFRGIVSNISLLQSEVSLIPIYDGMPHWQESLATFERNGFNVIGMFPICRDGQRVIEYDGLMVKTARNCTGKFQSSGRLTKC